ncbi:MAG: carbohydrate kinase family protein [bacterium]|nr:carbohydrate kinase family protein [bacterium]
MLDLISIGDATLDTFLQLDDASVLCDIDRRSCKLCLNYADKIPVKRLEQQIAGNACNVAAGAARLGLKTAFYSIVGNDETGQRIINGMKNEGVLLTYIETDKRRASNYSVVLNYKGERTILVYHQPRRYILPKLESARWLYYTSVGQNHNTLNEDILTYLRVSHPKAHLAFNPGTHQFRQVLAALLPIFKASEILFLNKEEAEGLVGRAENMKQLLDKIKKTGPRTAVITDGDKGAFVHDGAKSGYWYMPIFPLKVVEKTGAGDSFATGFVGALAYGGSLQDALLWGTANSASVVTKIGPQPGLLDQNGIKKIIQKFKKIRPKKIG